MRASFVRPRAEPVPDPSQLVEILLMYLGLKDAARMFNVTEGVIERWIHERNLPSIMMNRQHRFERSDLIEWAASTGTRVAPDLAAPWNGSSRKPGLAEALEAGGVRHGVKCSDRDSAIAAAVGLLDLPKGVDRGFLHDMIIAREAVGSTGIGGGIAIPHPNRPIVLDVNRPSMTICFLDRPVDFKASDGIPVGILFLLISPTVQTHLHLLSRLAFAIRDEAFSGALARRAGGEEIMELIRKTEAAFPSGAS